MAMTHEFSSNRGVCRHECRCGCHKTGGVHIRACCQGPCSICGNNISFGMMDDHLKECHHLGRKDSEK